MCGKFAEHAANFLKLMLPEYEGTVPFTLPFTLISNKHLDAVVHHFQSTPECISNFPSVMEGKPTKPQSGVGTNVNAASPQIPKAMFVGGGFSEDELQEMLQIAEGKAIPWLASDPNRKDEVRAKGLDAMMASIAERAKGELKEIGLGEGAEVVKGGLWRY
jgi:hypothetical protein